MCLGLWSHFPFFASLSLFSLYQSINISLYLMVTRRAESLLFDSGTSFLKPSFQPSKCQVVSTGLCAGLCRFGGICLSFTLNSWASSLWQERSDPLTRTCCFLISYPCWNWLASERSQVLHTALSPKVTLLGLPISSGVLSRKPLHLPPANRGGLLSALLLAPGLLCGSFPSSNALRGSFFSRTDRGRLWYKSEDLKINWC